MLYAATIFLSAFLLFQVQPVIAKLILPWFGGSSAVWTTCMLFFQALLVLGYLYSYVVVHRLSSRAQGLVHGTLLLVAALLLPILPGEAWKPTGGEDPALRILALLGVTVGLQYFLLATTTPLVQSWYSREKHGAIPYRLFALSNLGSMLALLTYPIGVEPWLPGRWQAFIWSTLFVVFALLAVALAWRGRNLPPEPRGVESMPATAPTRTDMALWIALPACASVLLLAVTSHLSQNVAPMPFLWIAPLALYLLSFIITFDSPVWYRRRIFIPLMAAAFVGMGLTLSRDYHNQPLAIMLPLYLGGLFVACMACHGELARAKPHPRHLTAYYLMMAIGGAIGGLFVSLVAPRWFDNFYELPVGMVATVLVVAWVFTRERSSLARPAARWTLALSAALAGGLAYAYKGATQDALVMVRNFYAALRVHETGSGEQATRVLTHGTITHGKQFLAPERRHEPTTYYGPQSGVGLAIAARRTVGTPLRIGVVGLGVGTLATYSQPGDVVRIYELDPQVVRLARNHFTYLGDAKGTIEMVLGDARLSLERERSSGEKFDVLAVDAFSSDSIPAHLLTREAFETYFAHMKPGGLLAVHISNRYLDLKPVVLAAAQTFGKEARLVDSDDDDKAAIYGATWVLIGDNAAAFAANGLEAQSEPLTSTRSARLWTDDFSDVYRILK